MSESSNTRSVCDKLRKQGAEIFSCVASRMQTPGWPDRFVAHKQWSGWIEFKREGENLNTLQSIIVRKLKERGANVAIVHHLNDGGLQVDNEITCGVETLLKVLRERTQNEKTL